jgi:hypothetical protein
MNEKLSDGRTFRRKGFGEMVVFNCESAQVTGARRPCSTVSLILKVPSSKAPQGASGSIGRPERLGSDIAALHRRYRMIVLEFSIAPSQTSRNPVAYRQPPPARRDILWRRSGDVSAPKEDSIVSREGLVHDTRLFNLCFPLPW